jgi:hypothetical protein
MPFESLYMVLDLFSPSFFWIVSSAGPRLSPNLPLNAHNIRLLCNTSNEIAVLPFSLQVQEFFTSVHILEDEDVLGYSCRRFLRSTE